MDTVAGWAHPRNNPAGVYSHSRLPRLHRSLRPPIMHSREFRLADELSGDLEWIVLGRQQLAS
jgi:hypothetical protein